MTKQELIALLDKYLAGEASAEEGDLLSRYYNSFQEAGHWPEDELGKKGDAAAKIFARIQEGIKANYGRNPAASSIDVESTQTGKVVQFNRKRRFFSFGKIVVAASVIALLGFGIYFLFNRGEKNEIAKTEELKKSSKNYILPGTDKAILTLADGSTIALDETQNGFLTKQGSTKVIKVNGKLAYNAVGVSKGEIVYNSISTPRGGQYQVALPDGSQVWLNAESSIRFPTAFAGKERRIELTGEGYFEVAHNPAMPFHVKVGDMDVQVLGTHFNINSYSDEPAVKTTLLEGKVLIEKNKKTVTLKPGQQSVIQSGSNDIKVINNEDIEEVVAWKNGRFQFNNSDVESVMRQVARWYDVEMVFKTKSSIKITGGLPRSQNITRLLKILEATDKLDFEINGKHIIVKPK